jgi:carbamoyl-phosphate synthase large subunit
MGYNILVTGCGGDIGQSIGKILKSNTIFSSVLGCDLHDNHAGKFIFDECHTIVECRSEDYLSDIEKIVIEHNIDLILPVSEPELRFLSGRGIDKLFNRPVIKANEVSLKIGFDKLATANFLRDHELPYPNSIIIADLVDPFFPIILKSRDGSGSKNLYIIADMEDFNYYSKKFPGFLAQEMIGSVDDEYTCGLFRSLSGEVRSIIYKRKLVGGFSGYGSVEKDEDIKHLLEKIALSLNLRGSINVQLRTSPKGPCVFEINPRFSSTVMFRHLMGFQDVIWSVQDTLSLPIDNYISSDKYSKFYKGYKEYVD